MTALLPRTIDWIELAPIAIVASAESAASPDEIFAVLADHERWPGWFPGVKKVEVTGPASGVGARRRVSVPGAVVDEEFIIWEPGVRWTFTGTAARPHVTKSLIEDCRLTPLESGGTRITYGMYVDPPTALRPLVKVMARQIRRNNTRAMVNLAQRAAVTSPLRRVGPVSCQEIGDISPDSVTRQMLDPRFRPGPRGCSG